MGPQEKRQIEVFEKDFDTLFSKHAAGQAWNKDEIAQMKDLKKLIYYTKVICAMDEGEDYPGEEYLEERRGGSGRRGRGMDGRYVSRDGKPGVVSGTYHHPMWDYNDHRYYDSDEMSGRRYYDDAKKDAVRKLRNKWESTDDEGLKNALKLAIDNLETPK